MARVKAQKAKAAQRLRARKALDLARARAAKEKERLRKEKAKAKEAALLAKQKEKELKAQLKQQTQELLKLRKAGRPRRNGDAERALLLRAEARPEDAEARRTRLKNLIKLGKERGFLTYSEINDHLPDDLVDAEQIEAIISTFGDMGIQVYDQAPDQETLLIAADAQPVAQTDEDEAAAEAAQSASLLKLKGEAMEKFNRIRRLYDKLLKALENKGSKDKDYLRVRDQISTELMTFRFTARTVERLSDSVRSLVDEIRRHERGILEICVEKAGMPRQHFIKIFAGTEGSKRWLTTELNVVNPWS